jgi:hypothetical protein
VTNEQRAGTTWYERNAKKKGPIFDAVCYWILFTWSLAGDKEVSNSVNAFAIWTTFLIKTIKSADRSFL